MHSIIPTSDFVFILKWWLTIFILGLSFLPLSLKVFDSFFDKGYLFSKVLGILGVSYIIYILSSLHLLQFSLTNIIIVLLLALAVNFLIFKNSLKTIKNNIILFIFEELLFFVGLLIWSIVRGFQPNIHDLEKFMDFGFLNSILRSEYFPPKDMWLTPFPINYYYFGHLYTATLTKLSQIPAFITFNLMMATIFSFTFTLSLSLGTTLIQKIKNFSVKKSLVLGLIFGYIVSLSGNLQTIYSLFKGYNGETPVPFWNLVLSISTFPNSYWYPNATRFIYHTIHEFPSYSFVVADLHGHVLDIPVVISLIALTLVFILEKKIRILNLSLFGFLIAIAYMTNAWDGLIYLGLFGLILLFIKHGEGNESSKSILRTILKSVKYVLYVLILFFVFTFVFNKNFVPFASGIGINCAPGFLVNMGHLGPFLFEKGQCQHSPIWQLLILYGFFLFMVISFLVFLRKKKILLSDQFILIISLFSFLLIIVPEFIYLKDIYTGHFRANTMFKLVYQAHIMLSLSSVYIIIRILSSIRNEFKSDLSKISAVFFIFWGGVLLFFVSIYPKFAVWSGYGDLKQYKSLSGITYLKELKPEDYKAINWLNANIKNQPVILEAQGDSYTDYARISANTGLPTVLGWTVHEWLWRGSYDIPAARFADIQNLYETENPSIAEKIIKKYNVSLIYVGTMEREKYKVAEEKFQKLGSLIYSQGNTRIYKIN